MPLTVRANGSSAPNLITAAWWNDYYNLLTGSMADQPVKVNNSLSLENHNSTPAITSATPQSGGSMGVGLYQYAITFVNSDGAESIPSSTISATTTSTNKTVQLTGLSLGEAGITARKVYRTQVGGGQLFLLGTISNNTDTTYTDAAADTALNGGFYVPLYPSLGGLILKGSDGTINGAIGNADFGPVYFAANTYMSFQLPAGRELLNLQSDGVYVEGGGATGLHINVGNTTTPSWIQTGAAGFGVKLANNTKIFEVKSNGNAVISGTTYATGGTGFDGFDFAECFSTDQEYPAGTVVCPIAPQVMGKCTHDGCYAASVISDTPGFLAGSPHEDYQPIALAGKVRVRTAYDIPLRSPVCSDGRGGVRPLQPGELAFSMGFVIEPTDDTGHVGIVIRNMLVKGS